MKLRAFKPLRDAGASWAEIARAAGCDWRTAKKYLEADTSTPPSYGPRPSKGKIIDPHRDVIDASCDGYVLETYRGCLHLGLVRAPCPPVEYERTLTTPDEPISSPLAA